MRKLVLGVLAVLTLGLTSCSEQSRVMNKAEDFVVKSLKDPSSYQKEEIKIVDTITMLELAQSNYDRCKRDYNTEKSFVDSNIEFNNKYGDNEFSIPVDKTILELYTKNLKESETKLEIAKKTPNEIGEIVIAFRYRAKNSFGALDVCNSMVYYEPSAKENDQFIIR